MMRTVTFRMLAAVLTLLLLCGCGEAGANRVSTASVSDVHHHSSSTPAAPDSSSSALCGATGFPFYPAVTGIDEYAWASEQIIVGTVTRQLPSKWSDPLTVGMEQQTGGISRSIRTDYVVTVQSRLRGVQTDTVTVATEGGTIGDCTIRNPETGTLTVGDRLMLFLTRPEDVRDTAPADASTAYVLVGGRSGELIVLDAETVAAYTDKSVQHSYGDLAIKVIAALHADAPPDDMSLPVISLDDAPAAATVEPLN